jgi:hypothetical protein
VRNSDQPTSLERWTTHIYRAIPVFLRCRCRTAARLASHGVQTCVRKSKIRSMTIVVRLPSMIADAIKSDGVWFERTPDLRGELASDPDHFLEQLPWVVEVVGYGADVVTVLVAGKEVANFLRRMSTHLRTKGSQQGSQGIHVQAKGPGGYIDLELANLDDSAAEQLANLLGQLSDGSDASGSN